MNSLERYISVLQGQTPDHIPRVPIVMQFAAERIGSNYAAFASDYRVLTRANHECARFFGFDQVSTISDPYRETQGFGSSITYREDGPPVSSHPLQQCRDLTGLMVPDPMKSERMLDRVRAVGEYKARVGGEYSILGWLEGPAAEAADLRGMMAFMIDLMDDPLYSAELMDRCIDVGIAFAKAQIEAGADTIGIGDAVASQVHPDTYETLIQPREKRLIDAIHGLGSRVRLHICGNITRLLPGIADLHVDILDVDHMVPLSTVRRAVGPTVALAGNLNPVETILNGTPQIIRDATRRAYEESGAPYMVAAGCEIPPGTPDENLLALCEPLLTTLTSGSAQDNAETV